MDCTWAANSVRGSLWTRSKTDVLWEVHGPAAVCPGTVLVGDGGTYLCGSTPIVLLLLIGLFSSVRTGHYHVWFHTWKAVVVSRLDGEPSSSGQSTPDWTGT